MDFWEEMNFMDGRIHRIVKLIHEDNEEIYIKSLPTQEHKKYGSPQLLLSQKPSENCLDKLREMYRIRIFQNDDGGDDYKYLMTIETLRFAFEEDWHWTGGRTDEFPLSKEVTGNSWDFDGYFYITDEFNDYRRIAVIPFKTNEGFESGHNLHRNDALRLTKNIIKQLNNGELLK